MSRVCRQQGSGSLLPTILTLSFAHNVDRAEEKCRERYDSRRIGTPMQDRKTTDGPINNPRAPLPLMNHMRTNKKG